jgi:predicted transcriptional regulator
MIKFFRKIRQNLLAEGKTGKYLTYAIGEIVLVVIGILIALSINNWNENRKEKIQIGNIYARVVKDFKNTSAEIDSIIKGANLKIPLMQKVLSEAVDRDSMLTDIAYLRNYFNSTMGFADIQIHDKGVRMLESKLSLNYELSTAYSEALILLYSEFLYEIEVDRVSLTGSFEKLKEYQANKGVRPILFVHDGKNRTIEMIFEDDVFKNHLFYYLGIYINYKNKLERFKTEGAVVIEKIKAEYDLE